MRVLFANDAPLGEGNSGARALALAVALDAAGHAVRAIDVGPAGAASRRISMRRVICSSNNPQAEIPFEAPRFGVATTGGRRFAELSDDELTNFRQVLRGALDTEIAEFDPQIIHCPHTWVLGHLALESGVPYVLTAQRDELDELVSDARYLRLMAEAAENAGRVIIADAGLAADVQSQFGDLEGRITVLRSSAAESSQHVSDECLAELAEIYAAVLDERLGRRWRA